jgi:hypothetical protein
MAQQCMGMGLIPDGSVLQSNVPYGGGGGINTILRVVVENAMYPVTLDVLHGVKRTHWNRKKSEQLKP